jgi:hypothetical protein
MKERAPYTYVLLRYRHDPLAGEFANVGVVLHAPESGFVGVRLRKTLGRLGKLFPGISKSDLTSSLNTIERSVRKLSPTSQTSLFERFSNAAELAARALPTDDSSYIWSNLHSGLTADPAKEVDRIYDRFVGRYDEDSSTRRDDQAVWQPVRERLSAKKLLDRLQPKVVVSPLDEVQFDNAWKNGAWHCYQPLSFDLTTAEGIREKAERWSGRMLGASKADEEIKPHFYVGAPSDKSLRLHYERAVELLKASPLNPQVFEEEQIDDFIREIVSEMQTSAHA